VPDDQLTLGGDAAGDGGGAEPFLPEQRDIPHLALAVHDCHGCDLWKPAKQAVFGEGPQDARLVLVGEQPGDQEDTEGRPFVGPAGHVLDEALETAGIDRATVYVTNAVKHFRFEQRGSRRLHKTPTVTQVRACGPWLIGELDAVRPSALGLLGATAAKAVLGQQFRLTVDRGEVLDHDGTPTVATAHPSAILRTPPEDRDEAVAALVADLRVLAGLRPA
jgi:uracil-DNA glycosylase